MSEMDRIKNLMLEQGDTGAIPETNHYRATGPTRTMVHLIARVLDLRVRTTLERVSDTNYLLWYQVIS